MKVTIPAMFLIKLWERVDLYLRPNRLPNIPLMSEVSSLSSEWHRRVTVTSPWKHHPEQARCTHPAGGRSQTENRVLAGPVHNFSQSHRLETPLPLRSDGLRVSTQGFPPNVH